MQKARVSPETNTKPKFTIILVLKVKYTAHYAAVIDICKMLRLVIWRQQTVYDRARYISASPLLRQIDFGKFRNGRGFKSHHATPTGGSEHAQTKWSVDGNSLKAFRIR